MRYSIQDISVLIAYGINSWSSLKFHPYLSDIPVTYSYIVGSRSDLYCVLRQVRDKGEMIFKIREKLLLLFHFQIPEG